MHTPLLDGGLLNHTNWFYQVRETVIGEQRLIEFEENEKQRKKIESKTKKSNVGKGKSIRH